MAKPPRGSDLVSVLRGLARVGSAVVDVRSQEVTRVWATSSLRPAVVEGATKLQEAVAAAVQQPETLQKNASKSASEALARLSMVTEGLRAYRGSSVQPAEETLDRVEDPMYDPSVKELNIEEFLMQEASSGSGLDALEPSSQDPLGRVQEEATNIVGKALSTREEVSKRVQEFEPLINIAKGEEIEITQEHLQVLNNKVSELEGISHGQNIVQEETEPSSVEENIVQSASASEPAEHTREVSGSTDSTQAQGLSIESMIMQEATSGHHDQILSDSQKYLYGEVQGAAEAVKKGIDDTKDEVNQRMLGFEPLLDITKSEEQEITEEHLEAINEKLSEIHDVSFGHDLKMFREIENPKPVEEVLQDIINQQAPVKQQVTETMQETEEMDLVESVPKENAGLSIESMIMQEATSGHHDQILSDSQKYLYEEVQGAAEAVKKGIDDTKDEVSQRMLGFEPLLDITKSEEQEITEEHLEAINEKLSEIHDVSFGHDLKTLQEIENPKPVEEVSQDIINHQAPVKEQVTQTMQETEEKDLVESVPEDNTKAQTKGTQEPTAASLEAAAELEDSISQVAKPVVLDDSYISTASEVKVDIQVDPPAEASQAESISSTQIVSDGASSSSPYTSQSPVTPDGTGGAVAAEISSMVATAAVGAGASFTVASAPAAATVAAAAAATITATAAAAAAPSVATPTPSVSFDGPVIASQANTAPAKPKPKLLGKKPLAKEKPKSTLSENAQARKVPHSRLGRLATFGGLAAGLGMGTLAEVTRRSLGLNQGKGSGSLLDSSPFLTEANARRIVDTLCRVRGAALKLGQMLSIQDSAIINPQLQKIFERVRQSADFMPTWQLEEAIKGQLGEDWRSTVATFDEKPFAAASIGQVHLATLHDGRSVAMKIQYPGVAEGIESDINNLVSTLKVANIFPEGLFVDSVIEVAKKELRWECDYVREVECTKRFRELVQPYPQFYVPEVIPELCTPQIFTSELIAGIPVDKCIDIDQESKNYISEQILRICLLELFQFGFMQTDPNWSNFFYNAETEQVALLDFGACRDYSKEFVDKYINLIYGAAMKDRERVLKYSQELGFLTGYEAKVMVDAHIDAIMILGEAFQEKKPFHFGDQNTTHRIQNLVPVMLSHRMCAPPEESYSLHRKMSGVFLLCTKLNGTVDCHGLFHEIFKNYKFGGTWEDLHAGRL
ncbi:atypical kinase coq-8, mitochondrial-like [Eriocheir sinensis]|uniref:atypical kinase coq-8, mitochondrial-like n=1 Tax=Eriocheir sinensis TaxID=95602 RepID=UPI0021C884B6|nr:atypical kinase coq-8, mitochondrial-like [Eriocheir sinensis]XP_050738542.1 atypical kinase coq-8, mitochondrial-like [Eriocheir sinensis]